MTIYLIGFGILAVIFAAGYGGLRVVLRFCGEKRRRWRDAADEYTEALKLLREARSSRKAARTRLADAKRGLKRAQRKRRTGGGGDDRVHVDIMRTAEDAVTDAVRALAEQDATVSARRDEMTERLQHVRVCAMEACATCARERWKICSETVKKEVKEWRERILNFVQNFLCETREECKKLINLVKRYYLGVGTLLTTITIIADQRYFHHFDVDALQFSSSASLSTFMSVLKSLFVAVLVVVTSFAIMFGCLCVFLVAHRLLKVLGVMLSATLPIVLGALWWMACHSTLCALLVAPPREDGNDG